MTISVLNAEGVTHGSAAIAPALQAQEIKPHLIHETVVAEAAWRRAGTHSTKTRSERRGGGRKPWRQKGTGRARAGSTRSPIWTGGGIVFGPTPRSYGGKVNRKIREQSFMAALRAHAERGTVALMDPTGWDEPSTKRAVEYLRQAPDRLDERPLGVVLGDPDSVEALSFRNIAGVEIIPAEGLETLDVMSVRSLLVERAVWEALVDAPCEVEDVEPKKKPKPPKKKQEPKKTAAPVEETPDDEASAEEAPVEEAASDDATEAAPAEADAPEGDEPTAETAEEPEAEQSEEQPEAEVDSDDETADEDEASSTDEDEEGVS